MTNRRFQCRENGNLIRCWNEFYRIEIDFLSDCFKDNNCLGDVDLPSPGIVERCGFLFLIDHKRSLNAINDAQYNCWLRFTRHLREDGVCGNTVFVFEGDAPTLRVDHFVTFWHGKIGELRTGPCERMKQSIQRWDKWTEQQPKMGWKFERAPKFPGLNPDPDFAKDAIRSSQQFEFVSGRRS